VLWHHKFRLNFLSRSWNMKSLFLTLQFPGLYKKSFIPASYKKIHCITNTFKVNKNLILLHPTMLTHHSPHEFYCDWKPEIVNAAKTFPWNFQQYTKHTDYATSISKIPKISSTESVPNILRSHALLDISHQNIWRFKL